MASGAAFDVVVVGAGPAGSACAIRLAREGARVALVERGRFERFRIGETVGAELRSALERLGLRCGAAGSWGVPCGGVSAAWGSSTLHTRPSLLNPHGLGWRVDRRAFDRALFEHAASAGAEVFAPARLRDVQRQSGWWTFAIDSDGGVTTGRTPFVVEATGRSGASPFAPRGSRLWLDRLVGVAAVGPCDGARAADPGSPAIVEAAERGWWYAADLLSGRTLAVFFTDADGLPRTPAGVRRLLEAELRVATATRQRAGFLRDPDGPLWWRTFDARSSVRRDAVSDGWAATGDALMAFDPLWGHGVTQAIGSGIDVADWLAARGERRNQAVPDWVIRASERFNRYLTERALIYARERRWEDSPFWQRRAAAA